MDTTKKTTVARKKAASPTNAATAKKTTKKVNATKTKVDIKKSIKNTDSSNIEWLLDLPNTRAPKKLQELKNGETLVCPDWYAFETPRSVGHMLIDSTQQKWWADSAAVHWLEASVGCGYGPDFYNFVIKKVKDNLHYGFQRKLALAEPEETEPAVADPPSEPVMEETNEPDPNATEDENTSQTF
jgi:hypothetical protein